MTDERQRLLDAFYWRTGPCCAGCDHWQHVNAMTGECAKAAPVAGADRAGVLGITSSSLAIGAGHPFTPREYGCGDFRDGFDWAQLPLAYRRGVGCPL